jgi:hypothetical protein
VTEPIALSAPGHLCRMAIAVTSPAWRHDAASHHSAPPPVEACKVPEPPRGSARDNAEQERHSVQRAQCG